MFSLSLIFSMRNLTVEREKELILSGGEEENVGRGE